LSEPAKATGQAMRKVMANTRLNILADPLKQIINYSGAPVRVYFTLLKVAAVN
jgi:hypothetical protein